eukprot:jgi/Psemu1/8067/gm1.8067_g
MVDHVSTPTVQGITIDTQRTNSPAGSVSASETQNTNYNTTDKTNSTSTNSSGAKDDPQDRIDNNINTYINKYVKEQMFRQMKFLVTNEQDNKGDKDKKEITDSKSGIKEGWSDEGHDLYIYEQLMKDLELELLQTYQQQSGYDMKRRQKEEAKTNQTKQKQKYDMMDSLDKKHKDCKIYLEHGHKF